MILSPKLDESYIFSKITYESIYNKELPGVPLKQAICSVLRKDNSPSLVLYMGESGQVRHRDMAYPEDNKYSGGAVDFIMSRYGLSFGKALFKIAQDFGIIDGSIQYNKELLNRIKPIAEKKECLIQVEARRWNKYDIEQWGQFLIPISFCKEEEIYPVKKLFVNRGEIPLRTGELVYAYKRPCGFQIYFPQRTKKEGRWLSNTPLTDVRHLENLSPTNNSLIVPSLKCYMVCKQIYPHVCNIKNESMGSVTPEIAKNITESSKKVFYGGNCDTQGKQASYKITGKYNWNHINPPDPLIPLGITDWSDWSRKDQSLISIENHFRSKGLFA